MQNKQVIILMTDTTRFDMLGCYGNARAHTPNLDQLAREGLRFDYAYTCQPVCGPARSAMFTGLFPHSNGSWSNSMPLGDNVKTLGQRLSDNGIHSAFIGKWHLDGGDYFGLGRCPNGYDPAYFYDMKLYLEELTEGERLKSRDKHLMEREDIDERFTFAHRCSDRAIQFLTANENTDFCLTVSYDEPHDPCLCPQPYASMFDGAALETPENVLDTLEGKPEHQQVWSGIRRMLDRSQIKLSGSTYQGCNSYVDYEIGRVLDSIKRFAPDALIIFSSDHGEMLESHSLSCKGPAPYDEITRIPFLVKGGAADAVCKHPASHIDIVPTVLDYMGIPLPRLLEGRSMLPCIHDPAARVNEHIFLEFGRYEVDHDGFGGFQPLRCVFDGRYKLCVNLLTSDELYDLQTDPGEMQNLIDCPETAEIRNALHDALLDWQNRTRDPFRGYYWERRPWRTDAAPANWRHTGYTRQRENEEYEPRQLDYNTGLPMVEATREKS